VRRRFDSCRGRHSVTAADDNPLDVIHEREAAPPTF